MKEYSRTTSKGYFIYVYHIVNTVMGDIVCYTFKDELKRSKIKDNDKGPYIEVRHKGKYYGRCYI